MGEDKVINKGLVENATSRIIDFKRPLNSDEIKAILCSKVKDYQSYLELKGKLRNALFNDFSYTLELYHELLEMLPNHELQECSMEFEDDCRLPLEIMSEKLEKMYSSTNVEYGSVFEYISDKFNEKDLNTINSLLINLNEDVLGKGSRELFADYCMEIYKKGVIEKFFSSEVINKIVEEISPTLSVYIEGSIYNYLFDIFSKSNMSYQEFFESLLHESQRDEILDVDTLSKYHLCENVIYGINDMRGKNAVNNKNFNDNAQFTFNILDYCSSNEQFDSLIHNLSQQVKTKLDSMNLCSIDRKSFEQFLSRNSKVNTDEVFAYVQKLQEGLDTFDVINYMDNLYDMIMAIQSQDVCYNQDGM